MINGKKFSKLINLSQLKSSKIPKHDNNSFKNSIELPFNYYSNETINSRGFSNKKFHSKPSYYNNKQKQLLTPSKYTVKYFSNNNNSEKNFFEQYNKQKEIFENNKFKVNPNNSEINDNKRDTQNSNDELDMDLKNIHKIDDISIQQPKQSQINFTVSENNTSKYVPEYFKNYSLTIVDSKEIDDILHNTEKKGTYYKYGLPSTNQLYKPHEEYLMELKEQEKDQPLTSTENMMKFFDLDKNSSYEALVLKYNNSFNNGK